MVKEISKKLEVNNELKRVVNVRTSAFLDLLKLPIHFLASAFLLFTFTVLISAPVSAQENEDKIPFDVVPPPLNIITDDEVDLLKAELKMKDRTKLSLHLMDIHLTRSEELLGQRDYQSSLNETGRFQAILKDVLNFLKINKDSKGSLKNFKKLEMSLRDYLPRLEILRREMPFKYGYHIKEMMFFVRESRTQALNPLFDDTVLPEVNN